MSPTEEHYGHGKLLLTGEYFVLEGARALAIPVKSGQRLVLSSQADTKDNYLEWKAYTYQGEEWIAERLQREEWLRYEAAASENIRDRLLQILAAAEKIREGCTRRLVGRRIVTHLEFNRKYGLGSSSTLLHCVARLLKIDAYELLDATFGGSGYDLACAAATGPIIYQTKNGHRTVEPVDWHPEWLKQSVFVYRNQKQNSREGIAHFRKRKSSPAALEAVDSMAGSLLATTVLATAQKIMTDHERVVGEAIGMPTVKEELFPDFPGAIKSLGAWGGDFVWALSEAPLEKNRAYFNGKGFPVVFNYSVMAL